MSHDLQLIVFSSLMVAQAFAAAYSYLSGWRPSDREQVEKRSVGATLALRSASHST